MFMALSTSLKWVRPINSKKDDMTEKLIITTNTIVGRKVEKGKKGGVRDTRLFYSNEFHVTTYKDCDRIEGTKSV